MDFGDMQICSCHHSLQYLLGFYSSFWFRPVFEIGIFQEKSNTQMFRFSSEYVPSQVLKANYMPYFAFMVLFIWLL